MTTDLIAEIEAALEKATPGPWDYESVEDGAVGVNAPDGQLVMETYSNGYDAILIAKARTWLPRLVAVVRETKHDLKLAGRRMSHSPPPPWAHNLRDVCSCILVVDFTVNAANAPSDWWAIGHAVIAALGLYVLTLRARP